MTEPSPPALYCDIAEGIATITISNPAKRNAMTEAMWRAVPPLLEQLAIDPVVRVVVLTGAGDTFCAGADIGNLPVLVNGSEPGGSEAGAPALAEEALAAFCKPTIAAISGYCIGGGVQLAVACDLRLATEGATFGITPAKFGVVYQVAALARLADLVGIAAAKELLYTADLVDAHHAVRIGLVNGIVTDGQLMDSVLARAHTIASRSQLTLQATKTLLAALAKGGNLDDAERAWQQEAARSGEATEGVGAFTERRRPDFPWTGSGSPRAAG